MAKASKKGKHRQRTERRYEPQAATNAWFTRILAAAGSIAMGAGVYSQIPSLRPEDAAPIAASPWLLGGGSVALAVALWFGTSGDAVIRVGDPGVGIDDGKTVRRIAWHAVASVSLGGGAVVVEGKDDEGKSLKIRASLKTQADAAGAIVHEARVRVPAVVGVPEDATTYIEGAGHAHAPEPLKVVGRACAASGKSITFEQDARVCGRCERVYHKASVPAECECGEALAASPAAATS